PAVRTHRASGRDGLGPGVGPQRLAIGEGAGGARLHALPAEGARRLLERAVELGGDLRGEAAALDADRVVALLLGAHANAAVARDALVVVAKDERIVVVSLALARGLALEALAGGAVARGERAQLLRGHA